MDKGKANERLKRKSKTSQEADEGIQLASESRQAAPIPQKPATKPTKAPSKFTPKASPATRKRKAPEPAVDTAPTSQQTQQEKSLHQPEPERPLKRSRQQGSPDSRPQASSAEAESTAQGRSATAEPEAVSEMAGDADAQQDSEGLDEGMPMRDRSTEAGNLEESDRQLIPHFFNPAEGMTKSVDLLFTIILSSMLASVTKNNLMLRQNARIIRTTA